MNIMVFDVPAEKGGALSILQECYNEACNSKKEINWTFVVSKVELKETKNIKVLKYPWIKNSWGHRLFFDYFIAHKLVKEYKIDKVLSLQNVVIPRIDCEQIVYLHQSLPFTPYKFSFKDNRLLWVYQNIIGKNIINSVKKARKIIVQTEWMKEACIRKCLVNEEKFSVIPPSISIDREDFFETTPETMSTFFFPANGSEYKNHQVILDACRQLKSKGVNEYKVIFTLFGNENVHVSNLHKQVCEENLPIFFVGVKTREEVLKYYSTSILIFPSMVETFGLPLLEARVANSIIFASNEPFSNEILRSYNNGYFFNVNDPNRLSQLMEKSIKLKIPHYNSKDKTEEKKNNKIISVLSD